MASRRRKEATGKKGRGFFLIKKILQHKHVKTSGGTCLDGGHGSGTNGEKGCRADDSRTTHRGASKSVARGGGIAREETEKSQGSRGKGSCGEGPVEVNRRERLKPPKVLWKRGKKIKHLF